MKKLLLLIAFLPFLSFGQESVLATKIDSVWVISEQVEDAVQFVLDDIRPNAYTVDSVLMQNDSTISVWFHNSSSSFADRVIGNYTGDTLYTVSETPSVSCLNTCQALYECGGCYKTATCGCVCLAGGVCSSVNVGFKTSMSNMVRKRLMDQ